MDNFEELLNKYIDLGITDLKSLSKDKMYQLCLEYMESIKHYCSVDTIYLPLQFSFLKDVSKISTNDLQEYVINEYFLDIEEKFEEKLESIKNYNWYQDSFDEQFTCGAA